MCNLMILIQHILLQVPMADTFRSEGKIYVVVAVILVLLLGLFYYLYRMDRRLKDLENKK